MPETATLPTKIPSKDCLVIGILEHVLYGGSTTRRSVDLFSQYVSLYFATGTAFELINTMMQGIPTTSASNNFPKARTEKVAEHGNFARLQLVSCIAYPDQYATNGGRHSRVFRNLAGGVQRASVSRPRPYCRLATHHALHTHGRTEREVNECLPP